ncbi:MAG: hypothetical protein UY56_C0005G0056 [Parcubacteria group bacterium GW2011_GWA1_50_14]|nr:MAG: hypothetical protein UY56_C0005G0056 [Parcubacteria group bacterium GW2011_GWA1_50_14]
MGGGTGSDVGIHPLATRRIVRIENWLEWKRHWLVAGSADELVGLLHVGFSKHPRTFEENVERICFYLDVADGWSGWQGMRQAMALSGAENPPSDEVDRVEVSEKAFRVLAKEGFGDGPGFPRHLLVSNIQLFSKILWFFGRSYNLPSSHAKEHFERSVNEFLVRFIKEIWGTGDEHPYFSMGHITQDAALRKRCFSARPDLVRIIAYLGKLRLLYSESILVDEASLEALAEIVRMFLKKKQKHTLVEAVALGSQAAEVFLLLKARNKGSELGVSLI